MGVAAALLYQDLTAAYSAGEALTFLKIPVVLVSYTSSVIPIVISVYALSKLEKELKKIVPTVCKTFLTPLLSLAIMVPAIYVPIVMNNIAEYGRDTLFTITGPNNMAQAGATLGVFLKTKDKSVKELVGPAALSAVLAGITEPAIYGVTLRFKRPFFIGAVFSGIAGAIVAAAGTGAPTLLGTSILTLPGYIGVGFVGFLIACAIAYFGSAIVTYFFGYSDDMLPKKEEKKEEPQEMIPAKDEALLAPVSGKVIPLSEVRDEAFAGGILGQGAAVIPENGEICAPCDGVISVMYPTGHAVGIKSDIGAEILIHVGMDMVTLNGSCFDVKVKAGDHVKAGQLLVRADIEGIKKEGLDITTPVIVANTADYMQIKTAAGECVKRGEVLLNCVSK